MKCIIQGYPLLNCKQLLSSVSSCEFSVLPWLQCLWYWQICLLLADTERGKLIGSNRNPEIYLKGHVGASQHPLRSGCHFFLMLTGAERWLLYFWRHSFSRSSGMTLCIPWVQMFKMLWLKAKAQNISLQLIRGKMSLKSCYFKRLRSKLRVVFVFSYSNIFIILRAQS